MSFPSINVRDFYESSGVAIPQRKLLQKIVNDETGTNEAIFVFKEWPACTDGSRGTHLRAVRATCLVFKHVDIDTEDDLFIDLCMSKWTDEEIDRIFTEDFLYPEVTREPKDEEIWAIWDEMSDKQRRLLFSWLGYNPNWK